MEGALEQIKIQLLYTRLKTLSDVEMEFPTKSTSDVLIRIRKMMIKTINEIEELTGKQLYLKSVDLLKLEGKLK